MATQKIGKINISYTVPQNQLQLYNALGRTTGAEMAQQQNGQGGSDNFFAKRGRSIENAFGTTGSALVSAVNDRIENDKTDQMRKDNKRSMNDIAKKFGYNSWSDWQDANAAARESGDTEAIKQFDKQLKEFQSQANINANKADEKAKSYEDYRQNDYISQKVNQDRGKFAGSAINTLSTAVDVTGLASGPLSNAIQGGVEGIADELEQNGLKDFSWERAGQNALVGATTGAVTGALNTGISNSLAKRAAAKGLTNTATKAGIGNALKNGAKTIATGAARGALSGAVGGATGAGLQSALNRVEFGQGVQNALQGAVQGAQQGAVTGGIMAGANAAFGKTNFGKQLQNAKTNWDQSGRNFDERLTNTLTSGDSAVGDWLMNKRQSNILGAAGSLGNRVKDVSLAEEAYNDGMAVLKSMSKADLRDELKQYNYTDKDLAGLSKNDLIEMLDETLPYGAEAYAGGNNSTGRVDAEEYIRSLTPESLREFMINEEGYSPDRVPKSKQAMLNRLDKDFVLDDLIGESFKPKSKYQQEYLVKGQDGYKSRLSAASDPDSAYYSRTNNDLINNEDYIKGYLGKNPSRGAVRNYNQASAFITDIVNGDSRYKSDADVIKSFNKLPVETQENVLKIGRNWLSDDFMNTLEQNATPTTAKGWAKKAGQRIVEDINNSNLGNRVKDVSSDMPEDIRNMQIRDYNAYADGEGNLAYQEALNRGLDQGLSGSELGDTLAPYSNLPAKVTGQELYELVQNDPQLKMAASYVANQIADDGGTPSYSNVANRYWDEVRTQYAQAQNYNGPGDYFDGTETYEMTAPRGTAGSRTSVQTTQVDPWDRVAQEAGYNNYDEVLQRYAEANPNAKINPRGMAGQVLTWMDQNPNTPTTAAGWAKRAGQRAVEDINNSNLGLRTRNVAAEDPSKQLYNALAGGQEPEYTAEAETYADENVVPSRTSKEGKLRYARGKELLRQYGTVDQPMARASRAVESVQEIADAGFTKPEDVERMANVITGSNGEVSKLTRNLIKNAAPVDTFAGENGQTIEDFIDNSIQLNSLYDTNKGKAVKQTIEANLRSLPSRAAGSVTYTDSPEDVFKVVQNLEASAAELEGRGGSRYFRPTVENIHQAAVLKDTASLLKQRLFDGADVKQALTPEVAQNLKSYDPKNQKYADWVDNTVMKAESINDLRAAQAPFVRMSKYIDNAYTQAATVGGRMAENANDLSRILTTRNGLLKAGIDAVWNSNAARRGRAAVYDKLADKAADSPTTAQGWAKQAGKRVAEDLGNTNLGNRIQDVSGDVVNPQVASPAELANATATYNPSTQLYNAIGRTEGAIAGEQSKPAQYLAQAAQEAEVVAPMEYATAPSSTIASSMDSGSTTLYDALGGTQTATGAATGNTTGATSNTGYFQPTGDYWTDIIASALSSAIEDRDVAAFAELYEMYQSAIANLNKTSSEKDYSDPTNWNSSDRSKLLSAQNGLDQIDQLENAYINATGGSGSNVVQGWLRSRAADISGGNWDPSASNYNNLAESVGMGIIKNLINLGVTESDAERYKKYLPALTDTKEQAEEKLATLRSIYQSQVNNLYSAYGV